MNLKLFKTNKILNKQQQQKSSLIVMMPYLQINWSQNFCAFCTIICYSMYNTAWQLLVFLNGRIIKWIIWISYSISPSSAQTESSCAGFFFSDVLPQAFQNLSKLQTCHQRGEKGRNLFDIKGKKKKKKLLPLPTGETVLWIMWA